MQPLYTSNFKLRICREIPAKLQRVQPRDEMQCDLFPTPQVFSFIDDRNNGGDKFPANALEMPGNLANFQTWTRI